MEYLQNILDSTQMPVISAFFLGLMTAISPCPLATNITATAYISKELEDKRRIFLNGIIYTLGRALSYTSIGVILYFGASKFHISKFFQGYSERLLGPFILLIGILMLDFIRINLPGTQKISEKIASNGKINSSWMALLLGIIFALAFCPYSAVLYFGMLIPMTIVSVKGLFLPLIFALATGIPVIIIAWLLAYSVSGIGNFYNRIRTFEKWFRYVVAVTFIFVGIYKTYTFYFAEI